MNEQELTPESSNADSAELQETPSNTPWLQGFVDIITNPEDLALRVVQSPARTIVCAILLFAFSMVIIQYLQAANDGIRQQNFTLQSQFIEKRMVKAGLTENQIEEQMDKVREGLNFSFVRALGIGIPFGLISVFIFGTMFWILQRLFNSEPPPAFAIIALVSYGTSITALGILLTGLMQYAGNSLYMSPTLAFLAQPIAEHPLLYQFLVGISIFTLWEYAVVGIVVARHVGMSRNQGLAFATAALTFRCLVLGLIPWGLTQLFS